MQKLTLALILMALSMPFARSQNCPSAGFSFPDSICAGTSLPLVNTSTGGTGSLTHHWDFCPGDLKQNPVYDTIGDFGTFASTTYGIDLAYDNGNWYGFAANAGLVSLTRYDFGSSLENIPVPTDLGNIGGMMNGETDLQVVKDNNTWHVFIIKYNGNIVRVDLDTSITNPLPLATQLNITPGFIANPFHLKVVKDHGSYKLLTTNTGTNTISVVDIGPVITNNNPTIANLANTFAGVWGITVVRDCNNWYGFTVSTSSSDVMRIDFGDTLTATPLAVTNIGVSGIIGTSNDIEIFNENGTWHGFTLGLSLCRINFGSSLNVQAPSVDVLPVNFSINELFFTMKRSGSQWIGITTYAVSDANPDLRKFIFPDSCSASLSNSESQSPSGISYSETGFQTVTLMVSDTIGNISTYADSIYIKSGPVAHFGHSPPCLGDTILFTDSTFIAGSTITSWSWDFGDSSTSLQQHPTHYYAAAGDYPVTLVVTGSTGCISTYTDTLFVRDAPLAAFTFTDSVCAGSPVIFTDQTTSLDPITGWSWNFGDSAFSSASNPVHPYGIGGTYPVVLTVASDKGCSATVSDTVFVRAQPESGFSALNTCIGGTVDFVNLSSISDSSALSYSWDFGDSGSSILQDPAYAYPAVVAVYNVTLIASTVFGCADTTAMEVRIGNQPVPSFIFSPLTVCKGNDVSFTDQSTVPGTDPGDTVNTWIWNFGDTGTSTQQNPVYVYGDTGTFVVSLTVTSPTSCDSTISQVIQVIAAPVAAFNYNDVCFGLTSTFTDFSSPPPGSAIISRSWDFGDSTSASGTSVSHVYSNPGVYPVVLTVTDTFGCTDFIMHLVSVYPLPQASFSNGIACTGSQLGFTNLSTITGDSITASSWTFGDGGISQVTNPFHTYSAFGQNLVTLIVSSSHGCSDTASQLIFVNQSPTPGFTYSQTCLGEATTFNYVANPFPPTINLYNWSFGDLTFDTDENPIHTYASAITYNATVTVTDNMGCVASVTLPVTVDPVPVPGFSISGGCAGIPALFSDSSSIASGTISSYFWDFGNGTVDSVPSPVVLFDSAGTFLVSLTVISDQGCADSITKPVAIAQLPEASFTQNATVGAPPFTVTFTNSSTGASSYLWDFGNGTTDTTSNPIHLFNDTGTFIITLYSFNQEGCTDSAFGSVTVLIPYIDIAVLSVSTVRQNGLLTISADLFNLGNMVINEFNIVAALEGGTILYESYDNAMPPGLLKYTFTSKLETNQYTNPDYVCVETRNPNGLIQDGVPENDKRCSGTGSSFEIIDIYNNPVTGHSTIHFNLPAAEDITLDIYDIIGKKVGGKISFRGVKGLNTYLFDARTLSKGAYSCVIRFRDEGKTKRLLKF